jgi:hypothetical protein
MLNVNVCLVAFGVVLSFGSKADAQTVDNPSYLMWSKWQEGATVTLKSESSVAGKSVSTTRMTFTLKTFSAESRRRNRQRDRPSGQDDEVASGHVRICGEGVRSKSDPKVKTTKGRRS